MKLLIICLLLSTATAFATEPPLRPTTWATPVLSAKLDNWYKVDDRLYRSAQPDKEAMTELKAMGIGRILNLRNFHDDTDETRGSGINLFAVPMQAERFSDEQIAEALAIITASDEPILVHCWHGSDRTGVVVAMYRIVVQNWPREAAIDELINGGYGHHSIYKNIPDYIRKVDIERILSLIKTRTGIKQNT